MRRALFLMVAGLGCGSDAASDDDFGTGGSEAVTGSGSTGGPSSTTTVDATSASSVADTSTDEGGPKLDVGSPDVGGSVGGCGVGRDGDAPGPCDEQAPPGAFEPDVQWSWAGENGDTQSMVNVLVANLTDDNGDGAIDLCDVPDIVVVAFPSYGNWENARMYALDGATGALHWGADTFLDAIADPALGDIDGDGLVEIVTVTADGRVIAFENDGTVAWIGAASNTWAPAVALADLDGDGGVEILIGDDVYDASGNLMWTSSVPSGPNPANTAADLDGDGDLELVLGHAALRPDGSVLWHQPAVVPGFPVVANFDDDALPEVLVTGDGGVSLLEGEDGTIVYNGLNPNGDPLGVNWRRPATVHDFDGDGSAEFAVSSADHYGVFTAMAEVVWSSVVDDASGTAAGTAFDFLGDGQAEAMYADEYNLFVFDEVGAPLFATPRSSGTAKEYPVVADVDNDGSAEIVVVSNASYMGQPQTAPVVQVIRDVKDRWIPARRIWNQHTYHVTNVREDGTIPANELPHWTALNTFRTQAQINATGGSVCEPAG